MTRFFAHLIAAIVLVIIVLLLTFSIGFFFSEMWNIAMPLVWSKAPKIDTYQGVALYVLLWMLAAPFSTRILLRDNEKS